MARLSGPRTTVRKARQLRRAMSLPENLLWRELKQLRGILKFRRQHPAGPYILDFYCAKASLAIEVDGEAHDRGDRPGRDEQRDAWLAEHGVRVIRIPAREVLCDPVAVAEAIVAEAGKR